MKYTLNDRISQFTRGGISSLLILGTLAGCKTTDLDFNFGSKRPAIIYLSQEPNKQASIGCASEILKDNVHNYEIKDSVIEVPVRGATYSSMPYAPNLGLSPVTTLKRLESLSTEDVLKDIKEKCKLQYEFKKEEKKDADDDFTFELITGIIGLVGAGAGIGGSGGGSNGGGQKSTPYILPTGGATPPSGL